MPAVAIQLFFSCVPLCNAVFDRGADARVSRIIENCIARRNTRGTHEKSECDGTGMMEMAALLVARTWRQFDTDTFLVFLLNSRIP